MRRPIVPAWATSSARRSPRSNRLLLFHLSPPERGEVILLHACGLDHGAVASSPLVEHVLIGSRARRGRDQGRAASRATCRTVPTGAFTRILRAVSMSAVASVRHRPCFVLAPPRTV